MVAGLPKTFQEMIDAFSDVVDLPRVEIFQAGDYGAKGRYGVAELEEIAGAFDPAKISAPLTVDHNQRGMAYGWATGVWREGERLFASFRQVPRFFAKLIASGRFQKRSVELFPPNAYPNQPTHYLKAVTFLGAVPPEVTGMADVVFSRSAGGPDGAAGSAIAMFEFLPNNPTEGDPTVDLEALKNENASLKQQVAELNGKLGTQANEMTAMSKQYTDLVAAAAETNRKMATMQVEFSKLQKQSRDRDAEAAFGTAWDKAYDDGKVMPSEREGLLNFYRMIVANEDRILAFSKPGDAAPTMATEFLASITNRPALGLTQAQGDNRDALRREGNQQHLDFAARREARVLEMQKAEPNLKLADAYERLDREGFK